jgi:hypothetical protein
MVQKCGVVSALALRTKILIDEERFAEAETLLPDLDSIDPHAQPYDHETVTAALVDLYEARGKPESAAPCANRGVMESGL